VFLDNVSNATRMPVLVVLAGMLLAVAVGCGPTAPFDIIPVTGKVTYEDGTTIPADRIEVIFNPQTEPIDQKTYPRQGAAEVNTADGTFSAMTTWKYGDGATVGPNKVTVISYDADENITDAVPEIYRDPETTPLGEVEVGSGSTHFEFKIKKE